MIMIYYWNKNLKNSPGSWYNNIKKTFIWCFYLKGCIFLEEVFQITAMRLSQSNKSLSY